MLGKRKEEVEKAHKSQIKQLEVISGLSADDAKQELVESLKSEAKNDAMVYIQDTMEEAKLTAEQDAKKIIINTIQRIGTEEAVDNCVSVFNIESDDVKGRIIGREGRNIRAIEAATGVEIIVDDTPEAIILSCFDSVRREVARLSLHKLVTDGRIHPARIEEIVKKTAGIRRPGSAALDLAYVAAGWFDGFWEIDLSTWDVAAGGLIVSEAGGMVSAFDEKNNWLLTGNIVATNPKIYDPLIKIIQQHIPEELRIKSSK